MNRRQMLQRSLLGAAALSGGFVVLGNTAFAQQTATPDDREDDENGDSANGTPLLGSPAFEPAVDLKTAQDTALDEGDGTRIRSIELDGSDGRLVYEVYLDDGMEIKIDAMSGDVIERDTSDPEDEDDSGESSDSSSGSPILGDPVFEPAIDLAKAQEIALTEQAGTVVRKVELDGEEGVLVWEVYLDNDSSVEIDATSGAVMDEHSNGDGDDDDDEDDDD